MARKKKKGRPGYRLAALLLLPLFLLLCSCGAMLPSGELPRTSTEEERLQAEAMVAAAQDALAIASGWLLPSDAAKGQKTLDALHKIIEASEFVPVSWATTVGTAMRLAAIWMVPPPPAQPPAAAPSG